MVPQGLTDEVGQQATVWVILDPSCGLNSTEKFVKLVLYSQSLRGIRHGGCDFCVTLSLEVGIFYYVEC